MIFKYSLCLGFRVEGFRVLGLSEGFSGSRFKALEGFSGLGLKVLVPIHLPMMSI